MKIFSWMQSKLNAKQVARKPNTVVANNPMGKATSNEEFSDWPQSLLAIGTFGISNLKADQEKESREEDGHELHEELITFLDTEESESAKETETHEPPCEEIVKRDICLQRSMSGMLSRGMKDMLVEQKNVRKKSLTFLLKKFFTTRNKFNHVRDSLHPTMDKSRMEKILRAMLNKKIHPQSSAAKALPNKNLASQDISMDDELSEGEDDYEGSIWVKTDSEYIVLEI